MVAVGFSSARVRAVVGTIARVLEFDESTFQPLLEREFQKLLLANDRESKKDPSELFGSILERIAQLDEQLSAIQAIRTENEREVSKALERGTAKLAEAERVETEAKTRHELRFGLDELSEALRKEDANHERAILRRLLVSNEANVKDATFDYLGSIYLDALDGPESIVSSSKYSSLRLDLIRTMRNHLSVRRSPFFDLRSPLLQSISIGIIAATYVGVYLFTLRIGPGMEFYQASTLTALAGIVAAGASFILLETLARPERKYRAFARRLDELRGRET